MKIMPAGATLAELKKQAKDCEDKAKHEPEPAAGRLRERAALLREWIATLRSGRWTS